MNYDQLALELHKKNKGKIAIASKVGVASKKDLSIAYTPGVAAPCKRIHEKPGTVYDYTAKSNLIAVVSDGSAVLGLGDIGPEAAIPVMEGKCVLFKAFANVDAFPICLKTQDPDEIVRTIQLMEPVFGGINLEDISAPRCFEIEKALKESLDIPVFHDDQHGTAVVTVAAVLNGLKLSNKKVQAIKVVINGSGAAGNAIAKLLISLGVPEILMCDRKGILHRKRTDMDVYKQELALLTNKKEESGDLAAAMVGADVFIGVSAPNVVTEDMVRSMAEKAIVLPMANPVPEIMPERAKAAGAFIVGTGRSDYPNQVNNVLAFPGIFRAALDIRASEINDAMYLAAAKALAGAVEEDLSVDCILPEAFDPHYTQKVVEEVKKAAIETGVARI